MPRNSSSPTWPGHAWKETSTPSIDGRIRPKRRFLITCAIAEETCTERGRPLDRMPVVILVLAVAETAWALLCAYTGINILVFYAVLVVASAVFYVPGLTESRGAAPRERLEG